jgi:hypothetical protein
MDTGKMTTGQKLVVYGGVFLVFNLLFIPWYRAGGFVDFGIGVDAFGAGFYAWFGSLCGIGAAALVYLKAAGRGKLASWQVKPEYIALVLAATGFVLILVRLITEAEAVFLGTILGLLVTAGMTFGAFVDSGLKLPQAKQGGAPPPPPPPPPPPA